MRDARRPREGGLRVGESAEGRGRMVDSAWWGTLAEMWCHVLEYASLVWRTVLATWVERGFG
jgi:hypothetical protein